MGLRLPAENGNRNDCSEGCRPMAYALLNNRFFLLSKAFG